MALTKTRNVKLQTQSSLQNALARNMKFEIGVMAFDAEYAGREVSPVSPDADDVLMIEPPPRSSK